MKENADSSQTALQRSSLRGPKDDKNKGSMNRLWPGTETTRSPMIGLPCTLSWIHSIPLSPASASRTAPPPGVA